MEMKLNLSRLRGAPGRAFPISGQVTLERIEQRGFTMAYKTEIRFRGEARYWPEPERVYLTLELQAEVERECSRCLRRFTVSVTRREQVVLGEEREFSLEQDLFVYDDDAEELDLLPYLQSLITSSLGSKPLCRPDCRGLCPDCGANLNEEEHRPDCPALQREVDPRLAILKELL